MYHLSDANFSLGRKIYKTARKAGLLTRETRREANARAFKSILNSSRDYTVIPRPPRGKRRLGLTGKGKGALTLGVGALGAGYGLSRERQKPEPPRRRGLFDLF